MARLSRNITLETTGILEHELRINLYKNLVGLPMERLTKQQKMLEED